MKIKIYKEDSEETKEEKISEENKEHVIMAKEEKPKYVISTKKTKTTSKKTSPVLTGFAGGILGGAIVFAGMYYTVDANKNNNDGIDKTSNEAITSYSFSTVENPATAIAETVSESVVGIKVSYTAQSFFGTSEAEGEGSGIVYSKDGYVITNYHVIEEAIDDKTAKVYVLFTGDDTEYEAKLVGSDEVTDIAVLKIDKENLKAAEFGDSDKVKVGDIAIAIGNPLGLEFAGTLTGGYISAVNRSITTDGRTYNLIQTDAAINSGNSGGALVNAKGQVIGINTAKIVATGVEGIGFAIPINDALDVIEELISTGKVLRPYIGIGGIGITSKQAEMYGLVEGVYVQQVESDSPAALAGLKQGDVITKIDGTQVKTVDEINEIKNKKKKGDTVVITVYREKEYKEIKVVLGEN